MRGGTEVCRIRCIRCLHYRHLLTNIYINLPKEAAFDTYSLKQDLQDEIKSVE